MLSPLSNTVIFFIISDIPINAELSERGLFWMATHFCCRFNAFKVLDYVLKTAYLEDPKHYSNYVNEQTIEGYTCIHLCAIWNAPQCLDLLLKFGGISLQLKDKNQVSAYYTATNYKRQEIKNVLKEYEDIGVKFIHVEH
jgi:ankyrin repeat protein